MRSVQTLALLSMSAALLAACSGGSSSLPAQSVAAYRPGIMPSGGATPPSSGGTSAPGAAATPETSASPSVEATNGGTPAPTATPRGAQASPTPRVSLEPRPVSTPSPTPTPTAAGSTAKVVGLFSRYFPNSPLTTPLSNQSFTTLSSSQMQTTWNEEGFGPTRSVATRIPVYVSSLPSDPVVTMVCTMYGGNCNNGATVKVHVNPADVVQDLSDHHIIIEDPQFGIAVDCWEAQYGNNYVVSLANNQLTCGWGGSYKIGTNGLRGNYSNESIGGEGFHFGPSAGSFMVTPQELLAGQINHAIALNATCLNSPDIYPADNTQQTDQSCDGSSNAPHYGNAIQLNWSQAKINASPYSAPCKAILTAERVYGAYFSDTGDQGTLIDTQSEEPYLANPLEMGVDPWPAVVAQLQSTGDADSSGNWNDCFNRLSASDFNLIQLNAP